MNPSDRKQALRMVTNGVYVLTVKDGDELGAGTVTWLSQASMDPKLVMVGLRCDSRIHALVEKTGRFTISVLATGQKEIAGRFFKAGEMENGRLNGCDIEEGPNGDPLLVDAPAWFQAEGRGTVREGDHTVVVGEVVEAGCRYEAEPLTLAETGWTYGG